MSRRYWRVKSVGSLFAAGILALALGACTPSATATPTPGPTPTRVPTVAPTSTPTTAATGVPTPTPTKAATTPTVVQTPTPTRPGATAPAPTPTATAVPIATPTPRPTPTPTPLGREPKRGGIATFSTRGDPRQGWIMSNSVTETVPGQPIFGMGSLVRPCRVNPFQACPGLAESWQPNSDFSAWTFTLRNNVFWHDGTPLTAQDIKFWMDVNIFGVEGKRPPHRNAASFGPVKGVDALDDKHVRVNLKDSNARFLSVLSQAFLSPDLPRHLVQPEFDKGNFAVTPADKGMVALGPFKFAEWVKGSRIRVTKFDRYYDKDVQGRQLPLLDGVTFAIIVDRETMVAAFRVGRIDGGSRGGGMFLLPEQADSIRKEMGDRAQFIKDPNPTDKFGFNMLIDSPFKDVRVRKAVSMSINRGEYQRLTSPGDPPGGIFLPVSVYANPDYMTWPGYDPSKRQQDMAEAKRLLAEAGYPNGFQTTWLARPDWTDRAEFIVGQLKDIGIQAKIEVVDQTTHTQRACSGEYIFGMFDSGNQLYNQPETAAIFLMPASIEPCADSRHDDQKIVEFNKKMNSGISEQEIIQTAREFERYVLLEKAYLVAFGFQNRLYPLRSYVMDVLDPVGAPSNFIDHAYTWLNK